MCTPSFLWLIVSTIFVELHGATMDIECGQSVVDMVESDETVSFQFVIDEEQHVLLIDTNNTFVSTVTIRDDAGNGQDVSAEESWSDPHPLSAGTYSVEMTADGKDGMFKMEMVCFTEDLSEFDVARILQHSTFYVFAARSESITTFESTFVDEVEPSRHHQDFDTDSDYEEDGPISGQVIVAAFWMFILGTVIYCVIPAVIVGVAIALCVYCCKKRRVNGTTAALGVDTGDDYVSGDDAERSGLVQNE